MTGRFRQALLEKGKMPKKFSVKSGDKSAAGGLTAKGVKRYRAANPGSKLKTAVTTKPSKLKKGSKAANRRKSFCSRMGGMKKKLTSKKTASDPDSRINKALRKWNCSTDVNPNALQQMAEMIKKKNPWAICTASVGRKDKKKYERCVKGVKKESDMNERNQANRARVRQMTTGQTPEETARQRSLSTANPNWIPKEGEESERQKAHRARRGVKEARRSLAEAILKQAPNLRDRVRNKELQGVPRRIAIEDEKRAQDDAKVKAAQGNNTVTKTFGKKPTQSSTTAYGGQAGSEEAKAKPMSKSQMDRAKGDEKTIANKAKANQDAFDNLMKGLASRG